MYRYNLTVALSWRLHVSISLILSCGTAGTAQFYTRFYFGAFILYIFCVYFVTITCSKIALGKVGEKIMLFIQETEFRIC